jgi:hypothetical protein
MRLILMHSKLSKYTMTTLSIIRELNLEINGERAQLIIYKRAHASSM